MSLPFILKKCVKTSIDLRHFCARKETVKTAGIIVIGDEILKGEVSDTNSTVITTHFYKNGIKVRKISVIGDEINEICNEVKQFSRDYCYVITSGGIGPTHDDVTFEAVAKAFGVPLVLNEELRKLCENFYKTTDTNHPGMKLALIPKTAKLNYSDNTNYPNVSVNNVFIFPGIPQLFLKSFSGLSDKLFKSTARFYCKCIYFNLTEDKISSELTNLVNKFPDVQFGSYPKLFDSNYKVKVTIESTNETEALAALNELLQRFPKESIVAVL